MSDIDNELSIVSDLSVEEVSNLFEGTTIGDSWVDIQLGKRKMVMSASPLPLPSDQLGGKVPNFRGFFPAFPRHTTVTDEMVEEESAVVATFVTLKERVSVGNYGLEHFPYLRWDWSDYGVRFNSHPAWWNRPESRVLRDRLRESGVDFEAHRWTTSAVHSGIYWLPGAAERSVWLWASRLTGADELRASLELLAAIVGVSAGFTRYDLEPKSFTVEIEALEELVRQIVLTADADPDRLETLPGWRNVLKDALSLLINAGRPLPEILAEDWQPLVAAARDRALQMVEDKTRTRRS